MMMRDYGSLEKMVNDENSNDPTEYTKKRPHGAVLRLNQHLCRVPDSDPDHRRVSKTPDQRPNNFVF